MSLLGEYEDVLRTEGLDVGYDRKAVIRGVNIDALRGQTICLIGPNGAGKTTILRTLAGMLAPVQGSVYINRDDIRDVSPKERARYMAVVLTDKPKMDLTSVYEVVSMGRTPFTDFFGRLGADDHRIVAESMQAVGAAELADRQFNSLSDGEKQKVMIARALAQEPQLIILDEPTSHLDIRHKIEVMSIINRLSNERRLTVILSLHDVDIAVKSCQNVLMVKDGQIVGQGRPEDVVGPGTIGSLYGINGASYDSLLGSFELCYQGPAEVYVAAGAGSGVPFYRSLSRLGYGLATGILHRNDIDYQVASAMQLTVVSERSFTPISRQQVDAAMGLLGEASFAIDAGFPLGDYNRESLAVLQSFAGGGGQVFCMRQASEAETLYPGLPVTPIASLAELHACMPPRRTGQSAEPAGGGEAAPAGPQPAAGPLPEEAHASATRLAGASGLGGARG
jgi:iron complex transport system ATP-binding protein